MKRILSLLLALVMLLSLCACQKKSEYGYEPDTRTLEEILAEMTLRDKADQMIQVEAAIVLDFDMLKYDTFGSLLSGGGTLEDEYMSAADWREYMVGVQQTMLEMDLQIPLFYGIDAVHGLNKVPNAVIFPHNIGIGAANNPELTYKMGQAVAEELKLTKVTLDFAPCIALADDPRWGRTYESFSTDVDIVTSLGTAFATGMLEAGVQPCAKHYIGDGATEFSEIGVSASGIDQGNALMDDAELEKLLEPYKALIDAGVNFVMPSFSSINGVKCHENKELLTDILRGELGFEGVVLSDYDAVNGLSGSIYNLKVCNAINAGVDMLMVAGTYGDTRDAIIWGVENGHITEERVDEAVMRILKVKQKMGLFEDPYIEFAEHAVKEPGSDEYRELAKELVSSSLVLLKNDGNVLPLQKGTTVLVTGPAANDVGAQCGGWTGSWGGQTDASAGRVVEGATSILEGLEEYAEEYDLTIITDTSKVDEADVVLVCVGEIPYVEGSGDDAYLSLTGGLALPGNKEALEFAAECEKPVVTLIVAGRNLMISNHIDNWDAAVMCYLPGSEGDGVAANLVGEHDFTGKLPMPWYNTVLDIDSDNPELLFELGYGLTY